MPGEREGQVVTFYSFKGGTGRTMAVANVAWILAANGKQVLVADWDVCVGAEVPHRAERFEAEAELLDVVVGEVLVEVHEAIDAEHAVGRFDEVPRAAPDVAAKAAVIGDKELPLAEEAVVGREHERHEAADRREPFAVPDAVIDVLAEVQVRAFRPDLCTAAVA